MFTVRGLTEVGGEEVSVSWYAPGERRGAPGNQRGLVGDEDLVRRALLDEAEGLRFPATPTGPDFAADLNDPVATLVQLTSNFALHPTAWMISRAEPWENGLYWPRLCHVEGEPPVLDFPIPDGAVPRRTPARSRSSSRDASRGDNSGAVMRPKLLPNGHLLVPRGSGIPWMTDPSKMDGVSGATVTPSRRSPRGTNATSEAKLSRSTSTSLLHLPEAPASQV